MNKKLVVLAGLLVTMAIQPTECKADEFNNLVLEDTINASNSKYFSVSQLFHHTNPPSSINYSKWIGDYYYTGKLFRTSKTIYKFYSEAVYSGRLPGYHRSELMSILVDK